MTTPFAKIYYDHDPRFVIGPMGYWAVGDEVVLHGGDCVIVTSLDLDGCAVAHRREHLDQVAFEKDCSFDEVMQSVSHVRTGWHPDNLNERQQQQCRDIAAAGARQRIEDEKRAAA
ncbi:hypothetical protein NBH00_05360 [Paraconexibacter antarcticus]|uniref:Uncharacterized protein n=1 Tax=Paraconexibacter antarcticus TaxID=2949664 RepID=A0ABY5DXJ6_9ACTN|nr:hypothetical protein [Paraconexibacter antarcticus]UTI65639.1 hypothetical protein NBH00_05360 [Paraconexibacter antarcticus]